MKQIYIDSYVWNTFGYKYQEIPDIINVIERNIENKPLYMDVYRHCIKIGRWKPKSKDYLYQ